MAARFTCAAILAFAASASAHPSSLTCMTEAENRLKPGATIMGNTVVADITTLSLKANAKAYTPGTPVNFTITNVPKGAFWALRASNQIGNFTAFSADVTHTTNCPSQVITPNDSNSPPFPPPSAWVEWTAPSGTTGTVTFTVVWGLGQLSPSGSWQGYVKTTDVALQASPRPFAVKRG